MEEKIVDCAKRIVAVLGAGREVNILRLSEHVGERSLVAYQALGWLAREGEIRYEQRGGQVFISLAHPTESRRST